jgi:hypothetical protein
MTRKWFSCLKALAHLVPCSFHHSLDTCTAAFKTSDSGTDSNPSKIDTNALSMRMMFAVWVLSTYIGHQYYVPHYLVRLILMSASFPWQATGTYLLSSCFERNCCRGRRDESVMYVFSFILWYAPARFQKSRLSSIWQSWFCRDGMRQQENGGGGGGRKGFTHLFAYWPSYR